MSAARTPEATAARVIAAATPGPAVDAEAMARRVLDASQAFSSEPEDLRGPQGEPGPRGPRGPKGDDGLSAFEIAVENGFRGTEREWLASLKGEKGDAGRAGASGVIVQQQAPVLTGSFFPAGW